jgi:8-oxo-dGTP diphosphatase
MLDNKIKNSSLAIFAQKEALRFKLKVGVFLFLVQNDQILLLKRHNTGIDDDHYVVPMGGIDGNETLTAALVREAYEEANILLNQEKINLCHIMHRLHFMPENLSFEQIDIFFLAHEYNGTIENKEPHKCSELKFYPIDNLPENTVPFIQYALERTLKKEFYSEFGW